MEPAIELTSLYIKYANSAKTILRKHSICKYDPNYFRANTLTLEGESLSLFISVLAVEQGEVHSVSYSGGFFKRAWSCFADALRVVWHLAYLPPMHLIKVSVEISVNCFKEDTCGYSPPVEVPDGLKPMTASVVGYALGTNKPVEIKT